MREIDVYSYRLGAADCFCEMVRAGVKKIALAHPCPTREERDEFIPEFERLAGEYGVKLYLEDEPLLTDLFPVSMNRGKFNAIFYTGGALEEYLALKREKADAFARGAYDAVREDIARRYGKLLSYTDEGIERLLKINNEKE